MILLDQRLNQNPSEDDIKKIVELRIRNLLCFRELQQYNDTGEFLNKHTFIVYQTDREQIEQLKEEGGFLDAFEKCKGNVRRYSSYLNNKKYTSEQKENYRERLRTHQERLAIFYEIEEQKLNV